MTVEETLILPADLKRIEKEAFWFYGAYPGCGTIIFPDGLEYIGENAFCGNKFLEDIIIPGTVEEIAEGAFNGICDSGNGNGSGNSENQHCQIILKDGIKSIGRIVFANSLGMGDDAIFRIPPSVQQFGSDNFHNAMNYASAIQVGWPSWQKPEGWADDWSEGASDRIIYEDGKYQDDVYYYNHNEDGAYTIAILKNDSHSSLIIPSVFNGQPVTAIGPGALNRFKYDGDIVIPDTVSNIGTYAFSSSNINGKITIPESVATVGKSAFYGWNENLTIVVPWPEGEKPEGWNDNWLYYYSGEEPKAEIIYNGGKSVEHEVGDIGSNVDASYDFS